MRIKFLAHACFLLTSKAGIKVLTDPYESGGYGGMINYGPIEEIVDIVTVSHEHADHGFVAGLKSTPLIVKDPGTREEKGITLKGFGTFHDTSSGSERGPNTIFVIQIDGLNICHLGDLGHMPDEKTISNIKPIDVLLAPVGGRPATLEPEEIMALAEKLAPKILIPMHFKTPQLGFPFKELHVFLEGKDSVKKMNSSKLDITKATLPATTEIYVLDHAL